MEIPYKDKRTGKAIETEIESVMWAVMDIERPTQPSMFPSQEVPRRVLLALNSRFAPLLSSPDLAQFMQGGEAIGAIASGKPSGAWARSIGLVLFTAWRMKPQEALDGTVGLTRRKLLETYPPKGANADDILNSANPGYAQEYWRVALSILVEQGIVERVGEAHPGNENKGKDGAKLPYRKWKNDWLDTEVFFTPGPVYQKNLRDVLINRFMARPKDLAAKPKNKGGRPRKNATA